MLQIKANMQERSAVETTKLLDIYQQETSHLANNPTAAGIMPVFRNVATTLKRKRRAMLPALPISRQLLVVPEIYQVRDIKYVLRKKVALKY